MARGLWRWWTEKDGVDTWWARVETSPGQWADVAQADYDDAGHSPRFWDLPLQGDHFEATMKGGDVLGTYDVVRPKWETDASHGTILVLMAVGAVVFLGTLLWLIFNAHVIGIEPR